MILCIFPVLLILIFFFSRRLRSFESHLSTIALSNVESSRTVSQILYELSDQENNWAAILSKYYFNLTNKTRTTTKQRLDPMKTMMINMNFNVFLLRWWLSPFESKRLSEEEEKPLIFMDFSTNFMCCATSEIHAKQTSTKKKIKRQPVSLS